MDQSHRDWWGRALWIGCLILIAPFVALQFAPPHQSALVWKTVLGRVHIYGVDRFQIKSVGNPKLFALQVGRGCITIVFPNVGSENPGVPEQGNGAHEEKRLVAEEAP